MIASSRNEHFWQATTCHPLLRFHTLEAALSYLRASLKGSILETLWTYARPEAPLPKPDSLFSLEVASEEAFGEQDL